MLRWYVINTYSGHEKKVQANIDAGIYDAGVLSSKHEAGVAWFQAHFQAVTEGS